MMNNNEELLPSFGDLFTLQEFVEQCSSGLITNYNGNGYYSDGRIFWRDKPALPSDMVRFKGVHYDAKHRFVIWFNK